MGEKKSFKEEKEIHCVHWSWWIKWGKKRELTIGLLTRGQLVTEKFQWSDLGESKIGECSQDNETARIGDTNNSFEEFSSKGL